MRAVCGVFLTIVFGVVACKDAGINAEDYPDYVTPLESEALQLQQAKISEIISVDRSSWDTPDERVESLTEDYFKTVISTYKNLASQWLYEYDQQGIININGMFYKQDVNQFISTSPDQFYPDTLFLSDQKYVIKTSQRKDQSWKNYLGGNRYEYSVEGYLIEEFLPKIYISDEAYYRIQVGHNYENGNRIKMTISKRYLGERGLKDSIAVSYQYDTKLINSGLPYPEFNVTYTQLGLGMLNTLDKYYPSLYGKYNRNLPVRAIISYYRRGIWVSEECNFKYTFNAKKQVASMLIVKRSENSGEGLYQTYEYVK